MVVVNFGSQYTQLIARRVREQGVYCVVQSPSAFSVSSSLRAVILSGGPYSVGSSGSPSFHFEKLPRGVCVLGICYGAQLLARFGGGEVVKSLHKEFGKSHLSLCADFSPEGSLLGSSASRAQVWMSHGDTIISLP